VRIPKAVTRNLDPHFRGRALDQYPCRSFSDLCAKPLHDLLTGTIMLFVVLALYRLLKGVDQNLAARMVLPGVRT
jgi:hypothetical protein